MNRTATEPVRIVSGNTRTPAPRAPDKHHAIGAARSSRYPVGSLEYREKQESGRSENPRTGPIFLIADRYCSASIVPFNWSNGPKTVNTTRPVGWAADTRAAPSRA